MVNLHPIGRWSIEIPVPDTTQQTDYTCGASSLQAVCRYYGVGPGYEPDYAWDLQMDPADGSHPYQIKRATQWYGLAYREYDPMTVDQLKYELKLGHPVMLMIQAWGGRKSYADVWDDGHWVVAIGHDRSGVYFEDPSIEACRGWLSYADLEDRWHDVDENERHVEHYGLALWLPSFTESAYASRAERIP